ncbi:hypothetical protein GCM10009716_17480 [Streptomyces sodiiphilus]|uniref:Thiocillin family RiPP n=1 Tax=Streptomyces sodiiphilus TaxID=226217 RepID=A0ABN2NZG3_9ACTN
MATNLTEELSIRDTTDGEAFDLAIGELETDVPAAEAGQWAWRTCAGVYCV